MQKVKLLIYLLLALAFSWFFGGKRGILPPLGHVLDPLHGVWQNAEGRSFDQGGELALSGLKAPASVWYDERRVPHVFAGNDHDLYYLQGYVTARDRLWQMEIQVMNAAGRLSEIIDKPEVLRRDRMMRRFGLTWGAERALETIKQDPRSQAIIDAYAEGVNAYIHSLSYADLPIEYKLMDYRPEEWTPLKTALLLKMMAWDLTGRTEDFQQTLSYDILGDSLYTQLFPLRPDSLDVPVIIPDSGWSHLRPLAVDTPVHVRKPSVILPELEYDDIDPNNGSNNWAVHGSRTETGYPMLANDPHLRLRLPSIWYEIQLHGPEHNVYGVSLPGAPAVIIGFNEQVAWGVTNGSRDVLDWYKIDFTDASGKEYKYGQGTEKTVFRVEEIKQRNGEVLLDTVRYTRYGPVVYDEHFGPKSRMPLHIAMRWTAHDPSNELNTFLTLNHAKGYSDYEKAMSTYQTPAQNFVFADRQNNIALRQQGRFPLRAPGQGGFIQYGSDPEAEWQGFIPFDQNPAVHNPASGFVSSANQFAASADYPYEQPGFYEHYRNRRIYELLSKDDRISAEDMKLFQQDIYNLMAKEILPPMLLAVDMGKLNESQKARYMQLKGWNYENHADSIGPVLFEAWREQLYQAIIGDELDSRKDPLTGEPLPAAGPSIYYLMKQVLADHDYLLIDDINTEGKEKLSDLVTRSWAEALERIEAWQKETGKPLKWSAWNDVSIEHLGRIGPFGRFGIETGGGRNILDAKFGQHGPSWRMVVSLGQKDNRGVEAWGIYPGGQCGNPGSYWYDHTVDDWAEGLYYKLSFITEPPAGEEWQELKLEPGA